MQSRKFVNQLKAVIDMAMSLGYRSMDDVVEEGRNRMQRAVQRRHNDAQTAVRFMDLRQPVRPRQDTIATVEPSICSENGVFLWRRKRSAQYFLTSRISRDFRNNSNI